MLAELPTAFADWGNAFVYIVSLAAIFGGTYKLFIKAVERIFIENITPFREETEREITALKQEMAVIETRIANLERALIKGAHQ